MERARHTSVIGTALRMEVRDLLLAFGLAEPHVKKGGTYKARMAEQQEIALSLVDWAICESDRGQQLLDSKTKPEDFSGGYITAWPQ